ncbi:M66 family metalloprotease [Pseudomonas sp. 148P]|uniref:M66 family metalloprotease n=1 Tax=Pseudomonas ulcerans TaxID=3115852 RepID=A0ABU7HZP5_9PSED|nr:MULTISPECIES: M66 family metalloprotease [unclassified Pseudomonas]MEE1925012.1 M66 family metalloprotease [Pseudomonas sp. 147P]MEE1936959.1 M66 family metalloprotease [Pseudomonas sp. 148P]
MSTTQQSQYFNQTTLRNSLGSGDLEAALLFAQVSVLPQHHATTPDEFKPWLVARRKTLVLFKPLNFSSPLTVVMMTVDGQFTTVMAYPHGLPTVTERSSDSAYANNAYGELFWSAVIPAKYVERGMRLEFKAAGMEGTHHATNIGAAGELLLNTIDIGMLTPNRRLFIDEFSPERQRQFFQTTPCSRLVVNQYEPVHFEVIELPDGTRYTDHSATKGGWLEGDLRELIGKQLVSLGINNAALGIHSSPGSGEDGLNRHWVVAQLTAHSSVGNYTNGRVVHGGSGGGSMVTLERCSGNEFSHEIGHNYGLGHYPGGFAGTVHRAAASPNSTWGWDSDKNVFLPNFHKNRSGESTCQDGECEAPFHGHAFGRDTMGDGYPLFPQTNEYTMLTPYSQRVAQTFMESRAVFSKTSSTGYRKWDPVTTRMVEWGELYRATPEEAGGGGLARLFKTFQRVEVDIFDGQWAAQIYLPTAGSANIGKEARIIHQATWDTTLHLNGSTLLLKRGDVWNFVYHDGSWQLFEEFPGHVAGRPQAIGVPATTLLGYYDPDLQRAGIVYPALHCVYGVTHVTASDAEVENARCYAVVNNSKDEELRFILHGTRLKAGELNRFHFNVPQDFQATHLRVICNGTRNVYGVLAPPKGTARVTFSGSDPD